MKVSIVENLDGTIAVVIPSPTALAEAMGHPTDSVTEDEFLAAEEAKTVVTLPSSTGRGIVDDSTLPDNAGTAQEYSLDEDTETVTQVVCSDQIRCFRDAWSWNGSAVIEDVTKVSDIKKSRVRVVRNKLLELSDKDEMKLVGPAGQPLTDMRTYRTELRDLGVDIDTDPDNLIWPSKP